MRILVGPDSFKDSVSANAFCAIAKDVINKHWPKDKVTLVPLADGGEGTVDALVSGQNGEYIEATVTDPLGNEINALYGLIEKGNVAIIEMAAASGLPLVPVQLRNPMNTTSYGTGELILDAIRRGVKKIIIGIGGSATSDAGIGLLQALGFKCLDKDGEEVPFGGSGLIELVDIIPPTKGDGTFLYEDLQIEVACDVTNPLFGKSGAAYVYGPQKGTDKDMIEVLDKGLKNFAAVTKASLGVRVDELSGGGAAGGLGACLFGALNASLRPGFEIIQEQVDLKKVLEEGVDLVITAEGQMNDQSLNGKLPVELAKLAKTYGAKTIAIVGARDIDIDEVRNFGIIGVYPIANGPMTLETSMEIGKALIKDTLTHVLTTIHEMNM